MMHAGCSRETPKLVIFHADSLAVPFRALEAEFRRSHPGVAVERECSGSNLAVRKIVDLGRPADVLATADYTLIEKLVMPSHCSWYVSFARNEVVIAHTGMSKYASEIDSTNWFDVLCRDDVELGYADPNVDPCGYWTLLCLKLADVHYQRPGAKGSIVARLTQRCPPRNIRPDANQLLPLVEAQGGLDYVFIYRSQAEQHNLKCVYLPPEINLGSPSLADHYGQVSVEVTGAGGKKFEQVGRPIVYGATIPDNAPHRRLAVEFVKLLLSQAGASIMREAGQVVISPGIVTGKTVPKEIECLTQKSAPPD